MSHKSNCFCSVQVCKLGVINTPCNSTALCLLGLAQLAQYDSDTGSEMGQAALDDACLSFQASIMLEGLPLTGDPPEHLISKRAPKGYISAYFDAQNPRSFLLSVYCFFFLQSPSY